MQPSLIEEFVEESREHLQIVEADFLKLEKTDEMPKCEVINRIFRAVHTIKGSAGFLGLVRIGELAHRMETLLAMVRDGAMPLTKPAVNVLLEGVDRLTSMLNEIDQSNAMDINDLLEKLQQRIEVDSDEGKRKSLQEKVSIPVHEGKGFALEAYNLNSIPHAHLSHLYVVTYDLVRFEQRKGKTPVQLIEYLSSMGTIIDGYLDFVGGHDLRKGLPSQPLVYRLLYGTVLDSSLISAAVELEMTQIEELDAKSIHPVVLVPEAESVFEPLFDCSSTLDIDPEPLTERAPMPQGIEPTAVSAEIREEQITTHTSDSVRIRLDILDRLMQLAGELVLVRNQQLMLVNRTDPISRANVQKLNIVTSDLQETIMRTRMQPIGTIFSRFSRMVRDLGQKLSKDIELEISGNEVELDKTILEALTDPLVHIVRNSCDHGLETPQIRRRNGKTETGKIVLKAYHEGGQMIVEISDNGTGIDTDAVRAKALEKGLKSAEELARMGLKEIQSLIFLPGFSTAHKVSDLSGRGVGMDVVKTSIERLGGVIDLSSEKNKGTRIVLRLPLTLAIIPSLIVRSGQQRFAIPQINLEELVCLYDEDVAGKIECAGSREVYRLRDFLLPLVRLARVLENRDVFSEEVKIKITEVERTLRESNHRRFLSENAQDKSCSILLSFAVLKVGGARFGLVIDDVIGTEEIVVKPMHRAVKSLSIYAGATVLGDGQVALILDVLGIARHANIEFDDHAQTNQHEDKHRDTTPRRRLFLFKSGHDEQFAVDMAAMRRVEQIQIEKIERTAGHDFVTIDGVSTQILRLDRLLPVSPVEMFPEMFLVLPKQSRVPYGILVSKIIDIGEFAFVPSTNIVSNPCVEGSAIIKDHMTLILTPDVIHKTARPDLFKEVSA